MKAKVTCETKWTVARDLNGEPIDGLDMLDWQDIFEQLHGNPRVTIDRHGDYLWFGSIEVSISA